MSTREHNYDVKVVWTGNRGQGTTSYTSYDRNHDISRAGKPVLPGSSDPTFRGDASRYNPEELLVASLSSCHMLWYLHLCAVNGVVITNYEDNATGVMSDNGDGGEFVEVTLHPRVTITSASDEKKARELHHSAHQRCYIANSVKFPVRNEPEIVKDNH